jgi:hypothetical protein
MPVQVMPAPDILLYSEVRIRDADGKPFVKYYFDKASAQSMGTADGTIASDSLALLLELDASNPAAGGHCKIKFKQGGVQVDAYVRRAHISST